jgi:hypothetical protein
MANSVRGALTKLRSGCKFGQLEMSGRNDSSARSGQLGQAHCPKRRRDVTCKDPEASESLDTSWNLSVCPSTPSALLGNLGAGRRKAEKFQRLGILPEEAGHFQKDSLNSQTELR